jgi:hypothetical protein
MSSAAQYLNAFALICNMLGVAVVWKYGCPQPSHDEGTALRLERNTPLPNGLTVDQQDKLVRARRASYMLQSSLGS